MRKKIEKLPPRDWVTTEELAELAIKTVEKMSPEEKAALRKREADHFAGLLLARFDPRGRRVN
jgi:hypothetical protein